MAAGYPRRPAKGNVNQMVDGAHVVTSVFPVMMLPYIGWCRWTLERPLAKRLSQGSPANRASALHRDIDRKRPRLIPETMPTRPASLTRPSWHRDVELSSTRADWNNCPPLAVYISEQSAVSDKSDSTALLPRVSDVKDGSQTGERR
jgi:hypothetical protein